MKRSKQPGKASMLLGDDELDRRLAPLRQARYDDSYPDVAAWLRRIEQARRSRRAETPGGRQWPAFVPTRRVKLALAFVVLVGCLGFVPVRYQETVGHLVYWTVEDAGDEAQALTEDYDFPQSQLVNAPHPTAQQVRFVLLLPSATQAKVAQWADQLRRDPRAADVEHVALQEEVNRSIYNAFFDNLPASLSKGLGVFSRASADRLRFVALARPHLQSWLNTDSRSYQLAFGVRNDTLRFIVHPYSRDAITTERERLFDELRRTDRALSFLEGDDPRVQQARTLLESYQDSLEAEVIYGDQ